MVNLIRCHACIITPRRLERTPRRSRLDLAEGLVFAHAMPLRPGHHPIVQAIRVGGWEPMLQVNYRRVVAYRAECECGWRSRSCASTAEARALATVHREELEPRRPEV